MSSLWSKGPASPRPWDGGVGEGAARAGPVLVLERGTGSSTNVLGAGPVWRPELGLRFLSTSGAGQVPGAPCKASRDGEMSLRLEASEDDFFGLRPLLTEGGPAGLLPELELGKLE